MLCRDYFGLFFKQASMQHLVKLRVNMNHITIIIDLASKYNEFQRPNDNLFKFYPLQNEIEFVATNAAIFDLGWSRLHHEKLQNYVNHVWQNIFVSNAQ